MKTEKEAAGSPTAESEGSLQLVVTGIVGEDLPVAMPSQVKMEPEEGQVNSWEDRWQNFLKEAESQVQLMNRLEISVILESLQWGLERPPYKEMKLEGNEDASLLESDQEMYQPIEEDQADTFDRSEIEDVVIDYPEENETQNSEEAPVSELDGSTSGGSLSPQDSTKTGHGTAASFVGERSPGNQA
ncbi:hypothetical protein E2320_014385 [Naja naja]|nr:hypothetical protein E2320_014385 [Naja naja]